MADLKTLNDTTFMIDKKGFNEVEIGDAKQADFYPQVKVKSWDNECNLSVRLAEDIKDATHSEKDGKVEWISAGGLKASIYELTTYSGCENGAIEFDLTLDKKPVSNVITYTIQTKEFDFFYQPELTDEEKYTTISGVKKQTRFRDNNVVGSYAVYHKTKKNNEYKTGKAFHIFRPWAEDATGKRVWCELNIDEQAGLLTITVSQKFLDTAVYPVLIDPTIGNTTAGSSWVDTSSSGDTHVAGILLDPTDGTGNTNIVTVDKVYAYMKGDGSGFTNFTAYAYKQLGSNNYTSYGSFTTASPTAAASWYSKTTSDSTEYLPGTESYFLVGYTGFVSEKAQVSYDSGNSYTGYDGDYAGNTFNISAGTGKYSVYIEYTDTGASATTLEFTDGTDSSSSWTNDSNAWDGSSTSYAERTPPYNAGEETTKKLVLITNDASSYSYGTITKVELYYDVGCLLAAGSNDEGAIHIQPSYDGSPGTEYSHQPVWNLMDDDEEYWIETVDITDDTNAPGDGNWTATDLQNIDVSFWCESNEPASFYTHDHKVYQALIIVTHIPPPTFDVDTTDINASTKIGGSNPSNDSFTIENSGSGELDWEITWDEEWLDVTPVSGTTTTETDTPVVSFDISGLAADTYIDTITITDAAASNSPQTIDVELVINDVESRTYQLHYRKGGATYDINLYDSPYYMDEYAMVRYSGETSYAGLDATTADEATDLRIRKDGVTYAFLATCSGTTGSGTPPTASSYIEVQRGTYPIGNTTETDAPGTTFGSLASTVVLNKCNRFCNAGDSATSDGTQRNVDDLSGAIQLTDVDEITFTRLASGESGDHDLEWESMEYKGDVGGANEFIVRHRGSTSLATTTQSANVTSFDDTISNIDDCIVYITGITNTDTGTNSNGGTALAYLWDDSGTKTLTVERGGSTGTTIVYYTIVEYTGSNWTVGFGYQSASSSDSGTMTLYSNAGLSSALTLNDTDNAFIAHTQSMADTGDIDEAIADNYPVSYISNTTTVAWAYDANHAATNEQNVYVLENSECSVTRFTDTSNTAGDSNVDITSAGLTDITKAAIFGTGISSGSGTAFGRGWRLYRITSTTNAQHFCHRSGNTMEHRIEIVDFSAMS